MPSGYFLNPLDRRQFMSKSNETNGSGIGCGTVLFFIFLILKMTGTIDWSWWYVTAPLWLPVSLVIGITALCFFMACLTEEPFHA
jgi:hypothetical protein